MSDIWQQQRDYFEKRLDEIRSKMSSEKPNFGLEHVDVHFLMSLASTPYTQDKDLEIARLNAMVNDLQSGMYVNCVYCGHRYGPGETTPVSMADVLKAHIEQCPKHPMSQLKAKNSVLVSAIRKAIAWARSGSERRDRLSDILTGALDSE